MEVNNNQIEIGDKSFVGSLNEVENGSEQTTLFIGDLSRDCSEDELYSIFSQYGEVRNVHIKRSKVTFEPLGYGFVKMASLEVAKYCVENLNEMIVKDRPIRVGWAKRNSKIQITFQDSSLTSEEINTAFGAFGELYEEETVLYKLLLEGNDPNAEELTAVIHYKKRDSADIAIRNYNTVNLRSKPILVEWSHNANNKNLSTKSRLQRLPMQFQNIPYISNKYIGAGYGGYGGNSGAGLAGRGAAYGNIGTGTGIGYIDSPVVSIYVRFETVEKYGRVTVVAIKTSLKDPTTGITSGYAFIHYDSSDTGRESAVNAVNATNGVVIEGVLYTAELSRNFRRGTMEDTYSSSGGGTTGSSNYSSSPVAVGGQESCSMMMMMPYNMNGSSTGSAYEGTFPNMNHSMRFGYPPQVPSSSSTPTTTIPYWSQYNNSNSNNQPYTNMTMGYHNGYSTIPPYPYINNNSSSSFDTYYPYPTSTTDGEEEEVDGGGGRSGSSGNGNGSSYMERQQQAPRRNSFPLYVNHPSNDFYSQQLPPSYYLQQQSQMGSPFPAPHFSNLTNPMTSFPSSTGGYMSTYPLAPTGGYWQPQPQLYYNNQQLPVTTRQPLPMYPESSQVPPDNSSPQYRNNGYIS